MLTMAVNGQAQVLEPGVRAEMVVDGRGQPDGGAGDQVRVMPASR
ncbi:hypothetical protein [Amycolatopsis marina]|nr:hypothetical protein [Amycolatopsis marina]